MKNFEKGKHSQCDGCKEYFYEVELIKIKDEGFEAMLCKDCLEDYINERGD